MQVERKECTVELVDNKLGYLPHIPFGFCATPLPCFVRDLQISERKQDSTRLSSFVALSFPFGRVTVRNGMNECMSEVTSSTADFLVSSST